jgi:DNA-binding transcriptional regulator GbsR (MarR family)
MTEFPNGVESSDHGETETPRLLDRDQIRRKFVEHWGMMASSWGINSTMGELFALLYVSGEDWTADSLREWLQVSRGNVSMNLRELLSWGVVHKVHRPGERREFFRAEADVWILFRRILSERKRRELDPTLHVLKDTVELLPAAGIERDDSLRDRIVALLQFFSLINSLAAKLLMLDPADLDEIKLLLDPPDEPPSV